MFDGRKKARGDPGLWNKDGNPLPFGRFSLVSSHSDIGGADRLAIG